MRRLFWNNSAAQMDAHQNLIHGHYQTNICSRGFIKQELCVVLMLLIPVDLTYLNRSYHNSIWVEIDAIFLFNRNVLTRA